MRTMKRSGSDPSVFRRARGKKRKSLLRYAFDHTSRLSLVLSAIALLGCAGTQSFERSLDEMWTWDGGVEATQIIQAIDKSSIPETVPAAVGVVGGGLVGRSLPDGKLWHYEGEVDVLPTLIADVVLFSGDGRVVMLDVTTGALRFSIDVSGRRLEGAGYDGKNAILLLVDSDDARQDQILVVGPRGKKGLSAMANARLGTPAAVGGIGLVPYSGQYLGAIELDSGKHLGRILVRDGIHSATAKDGKVIILGAGATFLGEQTTSSPDGLSLKLNPRNFPGEPSWPLDGSKPRPARASPVAIYAQPEDRAGESHFTDDTYASTYYEIAVGVEHRTNRILWSTHFPRTIVGGTVNNQGPTFCLDNGRLWRLNWKDGTTAPFGSLETKIKACVVTGSSAPAPQSDRPALLTQIQETVANTGPDMAAMHKELIAELGKKSGAPTTQALLSIAQNPLVSVELSRQAAKLLSLRKEGGEEMIRALLISAPQPPRAKPPQDEFDKPRQPAGVSSTPTKLDTAGKKSNEGSEAQSETWPDADTNPGETDTQKKKEKFLRPPADPSIEPERRASLRPPPVGALATALIRLKTPGAADALAPYISDPSLNPDDAFTVLKALAQLGGEDQVPEVKTFFLAYKNIGGDKQLIEALIVAAGFLFEHLSDPGRVSLQEAINESLTHPDLRSRLMRDPSDLPKKPSSDDPGEETTPGEIK